MDTFLGIDIAKRKFDVALLREDKYRSKVFENTEIGFEQLLEWLKKQNAASPRACLEATGEYGIELATFLHEHGILVSIVNPAQVKGFAKSELLRTKTDKVDARLIARFCRSNHPPGWCPVPLEIRQLQALTRRLDALKGMRRMEENRLESANSVVFSSVQSTSRFLEEQIELIKKAIREHIDRHPDLREKRDLLESVPGIGETTAAIFLTFLTANFKRAKQVAAFLGLNPALHESGTSVRGKARMSKTGDGHLRAALYMPAIVAMSHNPLIKEFSMRLLAAGKPKMLIVGAAMRKLVHIAFGVLHSGKPFDPKYADTAH
jgi:transposase